MDNTSKIDETAVMLIEFIESDFGQSGRDVQIEAVKLELEAMYNKGYEDAKKRDESE